MSWFNAYHSSGRLTAGLDAWITRQQFSGYNTRLEAQVALNHPAPGQTTLLAGMNPHYRYRASWNGMPLQTLEPRMGLVEVHLPTSGQGELGVLLIEEADGV
jgi:hypothetical protein